LNILRQCVRLKFIIVMMIEVVAFGCAPVLAAEILARFFPNVPVMLSGAWWPTALLFTAVMMTGLLSMGLHCARRRLCYDGIVIRLSIASVGTYVILCVTFSFDALHVISRSWLALTTLLGFVASVITLAVMANIRDKQRFKHRVVDYGTEPRAMSVAPLRRCTDSADS
jgi:hypothetical protein